MIIVNTYRVWLHCIFAAWHIIKHWTLCAATYQLISVMLICTYRSLNENHSHHPGLIAIPWSWCPHRTDISLARLTSHLHHVHYASPSCVNAISRILILAIPNTYPDLIIIQGLLPMQLEESGWGITPERSKVKSCTGLWLESSPGPWESEKIFASIKLAMELHHCSPSWLAGGRAYRYVGPHLQTSIVR